MLRKGQLLKTTALLVFFLCLVVFERLVNNRIADHLKKCGLYSDFQYGFMSSRSTADLLTVACDRVTRAFIRSGTTLVVALVISNAFGMVWPAGFLQKLKSYRISSQIFGLISSFLINGWLPVVLDGKAWQEYPVNAGVPQGSVLGPSLVLLYINDLPDNVICNIAFYTDDTTLYSKCDLASDLWQQLELASVLLIYKTLWTGPGGNLLILMLKNLNRFCLTSLISLLLLMWKWMGLLLRKSHLLRC